VLQTEKKNMEEIQSTITRQVSNTHTQLSFTLPHDNEHSRL